MSANDIRFSFRDCPTIEEFNNNDAFIRALVGPFGCLSGDTEFLTLAGWKRLDAYEDGDAVAQWHRSGRIEFVAPDAYVVEPCTQLIEFDSGSLVMRLSDEHRVPHLNWARKFQVRTAAEIERHPSLRTIPTTFDGPIIAGLGMSDDLIRFAVMMHADGHYPKQGRKASVSLRKDRKKERLRALLKRLGVGFSESVYAGRPTESVFRFVAPYRGKRFTAAWWRASAHDLAVVFDEMRHWDGHDGEMLIYSSKHREDADFIQYAAHSCGRRATISVIEPRQATWSHHYRVQIRVADNAKNRAMVRKETRIRRVPAPGGRKYCFSVPTGFFLARCDGTVFITGNSGKSAGCVHELVDRGQRQRRAPDGKRHSRWAVIRQTYPELRDTTIRTIHQWLPPQHFGHYVEAKHSYQIKAFQDVDMELLYLALDRPDDIKKLLSLELTGAWVNEAREVAWPLIDALTGRVGRFPAKIDGGCSWSGIWMDTNPPDTDTPFYRFFEDRTWLKDFQQMVRDGDLPATMRPEDYAQIFHQPSGLSPEAENIPNLPGERLYYARLAAGKKAEWIKVYVHGQYGFVVDGKAVYGEDYIDKAHCKEINPVDGLTIWRGWDFGLTPSCVFAQELPSGQLLVFNEMVSESMSVDAFSDEVVSHCARAFRGKVYYEDVGDPAGENRVETDANTSFKILQGKGINIRAAITNEPSMRIDAVRKALRTPSAEFEPRFILHPRCRVLRKGFMGGYQYRRMAIPGIERYAEKPNKNLYSHPQDALQYICLEFFGSALIEAPRDDDTPWDGFGQEGDYGTDPTRSTVTGY